MDAMPDEILVVIPARDEEATIASVVRQLRDEGLTRIRVVDNGSTDRTAAEASRAGAQILAEPERGYGRACQTGLTNLPSDIEWVLFCDGDGSDDLAGLHAFVAAASAADLVLGNRRANAESRAVLTAAQNCGNALAVALIRLGWGVQYSDLGPFRMVRRGALEAMRLQDQGCGWTVEMQVRAAELGLRTVEVPVRYFARRGGRSKISGSFRGALRAGSAILAKLGELYVQSTLRRMGRRHRREDKLVWNRSIT